MVDYLIFSLLLSTWSFFLNELVEEFIVYSKSILLFEFFIPGHLHT